MHLKSFSLSSHLAPFWQGAEIHSSVSTSQLTPSQPTSQAQVYLFSEDTQVELFLHGLERHSSEMVSQDKPDGACA